jgi:hypothetical protein
MNDGSDDSFLDSILESLEGTMVVEENLEPPQTQTSMVMASVRPVEF